MIVRLCPVLLCCCLAGLCRGGEPPLVLASLTGIVRDADGKPIAGAIVGLSGNRGYMTTIAHSEGTGQGRTNSEGKYRLAIYTRPGGKVLVTSVTTEAKGFVRFHEDFLVGDGPVLFPGKSAELNMVLARGEVLAGKFDVPLLNLERRRGATQADQQVIFDVHGPSFRQYYMTEKGCTFEIWVPRGPYTIELANDPRRARVRKENVP